MRKSARLAAVVLPALLVSAQSGAQSPAPPSAEALAAEIETLKRDYEVRLESLESQLSALKARSESAQATPASPAVRVKSTLDNAFNPAIGIVLDGKYASFSTEGSSIPGFVLGHEAERAPEGLSLGHSEVTASGNIDDKFRGNLTLGLGAHPGEATEVELEEAYIQTLPGAGLPEGLRVKAGRALWTFGYLNEQHAHGDDFADRPLPYRAFLDNAFNDDGVELSFVLPSALYGEVGGGLFRGDDRPLFGGSDNGLRARSVYARVGGDIGRNAAWRIGGYLLDGRSLNRSGGGHEDEHGHNDDDEHALEDDEHGHEDEDEHGHEDDEHALEDDEHAHEDEDEHGHEDDEHGHEDDEHAHEDEHEEEFAEFFSNGMFTGDTRLYGIDVRFTMAPTGNARESEVILQAEYFWRQEDGTYALAEEEDGEEHIDELRTDSIAQGWYVQGVYKMSPRWRIGARYAQLVPPDDAEIDHDPYAFGMMVDWTNSEFGRVRLQYNHEALDGYEEDNQFILQYVMSLGAHGAHSF